MQKESIVDCRNMLKELERLLGRVSPAEAMKLLEKRAQLIDASSRFMVPGAVEPETQPALSNEPPEPAPEVQQALRRAQLVMASLV